MQHCRSILDTGVGSGNLTINLADNLRRVVAIDSEPYALGLLRDKAKREQKNIEVVQGDVQEIPFQENEFDEVSSMFLIPFIRDNEKYFNEVYRVLKPGGIFSASIWAPVQDVEGDWDLKEVVEKKFMEDEILPKYQQEWDELLYTSKINANDIDSKNLTYSRIKESLEDIGFINISLHRNVAYGEYAYHLTSEKD